MPRYQVTAVQTTYFRGEIFADNIEDLWDMDLEDADLEEFDNSDLTLDSAQEI